MQQGDIGHLARDVARVHHGHARVGGGQRRRVVHPVADHHHRAALALERIEHRGLVLGQHLTSVLVDAELLGGHTRGAFRIAGEHDDARETRPAQRSNRRGGLGAHRIVDADGAFQLVAAGKVDDRGSRRLVGDALLETGRALYPLVVEDEMRAAQQHAPPVHARDDAVCHDVLDVGMLLIDVRHAACARGLDHGTRHAVREVLLQAGGQAQHLVGVHVGKGQHLRDVRDRGRECARLVEDDGVGTGHNLQVAPAFHHDAVVGTFAHSPHHRDGRGQLDSARIVHHQHGDGLRHVAGEGEHGEKPEKTIGHDGVGQALGAALHAGFGLLGLVDHAHNVGDARVGAGLAHLHDDRAVLDDGARIDRGAG